MTLLDWAPVVRDDEASGRFDGWRYEALPPGQRERGLAVCPKCLTEDSEPYIRKEWLIGWVAACPVHRSALHEVLESLVQGFEDDSQFKFVWERSLEGNGRNYP
jgi:hypothetical protein